MTVAGPDASDDIWHGCCCWNPAPGLISGALFAFATSFDEVVVTLFVAGPGQTTLPRQMFTGIRENISPTIAALATILIIFSTCLLLVLEWLRGRNKAAAKF